MNESADEQKFLNESERLNLIIFSQKIEAIESKKAALNQVFANKQLQIKNYQLLIDKMNTDCTLVRNEIDHTEKKKQDVVAQRNNFVKEIAEKYNIKHEQFGYDDETGKIIIAPDEIVEQNK